MTKINKNSDKTENKDTQTKYIQKPITSIQYKNITGKFDGMLTVAMMDSDALNVLNNKEIFKLIVNGIEHLSEEDITKVVAHMYNETKEKTGHRFSTAKIRSMITTYIDSKDKDDWKGRHLVDEEEGEIFVMTSRKTGETISISNFTLDPKYTVTVQGEGGDKFHLYKVKIKNDNKTYTLKLKSDDFNKLDALQDTIRLQLSHTSANINGCAQYMKDLFHKYVTLAEFEYNQFGTSLLGLERFENDGPKYFCSPTGIYGLDGLASTDIVFMGNERSNQDELRNLTNLEYDTKKWKAKIAPTFLRHIVRINEKTSMMSILGWMGAIPHDYVIRKEAGTGFFPHCHIVGEPGSGKSTIMTIVKQFMGHNDSTPRTFPTAFEVSKLLNSSYTIPVVLDEYGKRWNVFDTDKMNKILVEAFTKARWSRGQSNLGSVYFKYKNPILMGGQVPTSDQALAERIVPITVYKSYQNTKLGKEAYTHLREIQKMEDKNFWVGYNLWCAQHTNDEVTAIYEKYRSYCRSVVEENRIADIYAVVMLGLHFMKKLALELGVSESDLGYTDTDIFGMAKNLDSTADSTDNKETPLTLFLQEFAQYAVSIGNGQRGNYFGKGLAVMESTPSHTGAGEYSGKETACIYGKDMLLVKIDEMVKVLNNNRKRDTFNEKEIMTFINAEFRKSLQNPLSCDNLVLAPKQYRNKYGRFTAFCKDTLYEMHGEFRNVLWKNS